MFLYVLSVFTNCFDILEHASHHLCHHSSHNNDEVIYPSPQPFEHL